MKVSDIEIGRQVLVELKPIGAETFNNAPPVLSEVMVRWLATAEEVWLWSGEQNWPVVGADARHHELITDLLRAGSPRLCWLAGAIRKKDQPSSLNVQIHTFSRRIELPQPAVIAVGDQIIEDICGRMLRRKLGAVEVLKWLSDGILLDSPSPTRALISAGPQPISADLPSFRIYGQRIAVDVEKSADGKYRVTKVLHASRQNAERHPLILVEGPISFSDETVAGQFASTDPTLLDSIVHQSGSYLVIWREYNKVERDIIWARARKFRWLRYGRCERRDDGSWCFYAERSDGIETMLASLKDYADLSLEAGEQVPEELKQEGAAQDNPEDSDSSTFRGRRFVGQCVDVNEEQGSVIVRPVDVESEDNPPKTGYLYISLAGDHVRLKRRELARRRIESSAGSMHWLLRLLLEGQPIPVADRRYIKPDLKSVRDLFDGVPTERQVKALEIALNTPDIALIQGPPGTGKTRIIAALERLLTDLHKKQGVAGRILVTSYQHDAVEHVADRTLVMGLPAVKVGRRSDQADAYHGVENWRTARIEEIDQYLQGCSEPVGSHVLHQIRALARGYIRQPGNSQETADLLQQVARITLGMIPTELRERLSDLATRLHTPIPSNTDEHTLALQAVRALRTQPEAFADDGSMTTYRLLRRLEKSETLEALLTDADCQCLRHAAEWVEGDDLSFLPELEVLQNRLLDRLTASTVLDQMPLVNTDVTAVLTEVNEALYQLVCRNRQPEQAALYDYRDALENDPYGVHRTLQAYTAVLAATCQQAVSTPMEKLKGDADFSFDTVIVDEAARANPLDLLIPMARAERRIILVGDHRQLPHILEPDVERQLEFSQEGTQEKLHESLFDRLFQHAVQLQQAGEIQRAVTLNKQYRMHPVLGDFVSEAFYPESERFSSPRPATEFEHNLQPYEGKVAVWKNIPLSAGTERGSRSKYRRAEAKWIADETLRILDQREDLSIGVITFYSDQEREIRREMQRLAIIDQTDLGFEIAKRYQKARDAEGRSIERLRVGTVDAFQGKEFDIVLLSMTRCNSLPAADKLSARRKYGFLTLQNRLCVAMSRQKRLLMVVGDAGMLEEPLAAEEIRGLAAFYELCDGAYGIRL